MRALGGRNTRTSKTTTTITMTITMTVSGIGIGLGGPSLAEKNYGPTASRGTKPATIHPRRGLREGLWMRRGQKGERERERRAYQTRRNRQGKIRQDKRGLARATACCPRLSGTRQFPGRQERRLTINPTASSGKMNAFLTAKNTDKTGGNGNTTDPPSPPPLGVRNKK